MLDSSNNNCVDDSSDRREQPITEGGDVGITILDDIRSYLARFIVYPSGHANIAHTLWIAHTYLMDVWETTPRIAFLSPEPSSGKSRALEVMEPLVCNPVQAINVSAAYLFRKIGDKQGRPTILYDEIDTIFGPKARANEELRAVLNAGYRTHSVAGRCEVRGKKVVTKDLPAYCAVALAGLGSLPDTILTRSIVIRMRRRALSERIEPYRCRAERVVADRLRERLSAWAESIRDSVMASPPEMPDGVEDRDADVWEALLAVADVAGGEWPRLARDAAVAFVAESKQSTPSLGVLLLGDLRRIFGDLEAMSTMEILAALNRLDESPWRTLNGVPLDERKLSNLLKPFGVNSTSVRIGGRTPKGYRREHLHDSWVRYLPPLQISPQQPQHLQSAPIVKAE